MDTKKLGQIIDSSRSAQRYTKVALADKARVHRNTVNLVCNGKASPGMPLTVFVRLCAALGLAPAEVLAQITGEKTPHV